MIVNSVMRRMVRKATVFDQQRGLLFHRGKLKKVLEPGYYNFWWSRKYAIQIVDLRPASMVVASQEVLTSEGVPVRLSIVVAAAVEDPRKHVEAAQEPWNSLYADLQIVIRGLVAARSLDQLMTDRSELNAELASETRNAAGKYAVKVDGASVRDITVAGDVKKAYAEVLKARKQGEAALERARGETASLRSLANAARMVSDQPALLQLRAIQALAESSGSSLVLGADAIRVTGGITAGGGRKGTEHRPESE